MQKIIFWWLTLKFEKVEFDKIVSPAKKNLCKDKYLALKFKMICKQLIPLTVLYCNCGYKE
jgi:hypothetical protein